MTNQSHGQNHRTPTPWLKWKRRRRRQLPGRASAGPLNTPASLDIRAVLPPEPSLATPWPSDPAPCVCHGGALSSLGRCQGASRGLARMERQTPCRRVSRQGAGRQRRTQRSRMCGTGPGGLAAQVETGSRPAVGVLPPAVELTAGSRQALFSERRPWSRVGWEGAPGRAAHLGSCSPWGSGWRAGLGRPFRLEPVSARQPHVPAWSLRPRTTLMTVTCTASSCGNPLTASRPLQTDVLHQNIYDYIHVDDRQDFRRQLHWAMDPPHAALGRPLRSEAAEDAALGRLLRAQEGGAGSPAEYSAFLTRCFVCRVRCLLDSTSGFLAMQFQGKLKFLFGQKRKAPSGTALPPRLSLFCTAAPALLPSTAETKVKSTFLKLKHGADISALTDARAKAQSQCEPESHVKPNHSAGRNSAENGLSVFRAQTDGDRWAQLPARATCPCLRGGPDSVLDPRVASGGGAGEGRGRAPGGSSTARWRREGHAYDRHLEAAGPAQQLHWMTGALGQEGGTRLKLEPSMGGPFPGQAGAQGIVHTDSFTASGSPLVSHPSNRLPSAYTGRLGRTLRDGGQAQGLPPASFPLPQRSLENGLPPPRGQRLAVGGYCTQDTKFGGELVPPGSLCSPTLSLDVPIKMESDSGSDDAADSYSVSPSQVWLGATDVVKRQLVTFPTRMHLKTELGHRHQLCAPHLGHSVLGANPRPGCNLALFHPTRCACLEHVHCVPEPEPPPNFCAQGHQPPTLGRNCRAPGTLPVIKREPLDSPPWATHSQGRVSGTFPKSALATLMLPKAPEGTFLL
ncbi:aryl hydrocarbon receptor repressor isoform X1 [Manis pentadactyla]|uniref:aryl hydrocarbon receptor repressor isoform X1 n=1 Tax=Manis pentadactyla TaxID=143292 RepID=UPI00255C7814|nr:aryl hydrocarbon receptor repressor isoform X1 [Manis pentadactyla]